MPPVRGQPSDVEAIAEPLLPPPMADPAGAAPAGGAALQPNGAAAAAGNNNNAIDEGFTCGIGPRTVFGINRNSLVLIIQLLSIVLGAINAGLHDNPNATLVLGIVVAAFNGMAAVLKNDQGEAPAGPGAPTAAGLI